MNTVARIVSSPVVAALALALSATASRAEIHTCTDAQGQAVYQEDACDSPAMPSKFAAPRVVKTSPKPAPAEPAAARPAAARPLFVMPHAVRPAAAPKSFTSDPRWGSPERTLHTFVAAMRRGDRELAASCLTAGALTDYGPRVASLPLESLRATVDAFTGFVPEGDLGPFWSIRALRGKDRPKWIFFEKTGDGTWKISAI